MKVNIMKPLNKKRSLFNELAMGKLLLNPNWQKSSYRTKFLFRSLFIYPETLFLLKKLSCYSHVDHFLTQQTNLPCKLQRPYLASNIARHQRYRILLSHYDFISRLSPNLIEKFYAPYPTLLATITGENGLPLFIYIESNDKYAREGELTITVCNQDQIVLAALTFAIIKYKQQPTLFIGGLQGSNHEDLNALIQQATKIAYGTFPKTLVVETALTMANYLNIHQILAVSNKTHVYNNWRYYRKSAKRYTDYDHYWQALNSTLNNDKYYKLPLQLEGKITESILKEKNAKHQNKYQLLNKLSQDIMTRLAVLEQNLIAKDSHPCM